MNATPLQPADSSSQAGRSTRGGVPPLAQDPAPRRSAAGGVEPGASSAPGDPQESAAPVVRVEPGGSTAAGAPASPRPGGAPGRGPGTTGRGRAWLRIAFCPGAQPDKWFTRFNERTPGWTVHPIPAEDPIACVLAGEADLALARTSTRGFLRDLGESGTPLVAAAAVPGGGAELTAEDFLAVQLYTEAVGVAAPADHPIKVMDAIDPEELGDEMVLYATPAAGAGSDGSPAGKDRSGQLSPVDVAAVREALHVVAANVGIVLAPRPLLRALNVRGVVHRDVQTDVHPRVHPDARRQDRDERESAELPPLTVAGRAVGSTGIALVWLRSGDSPQVQDFVGICRGRRTGSSRQSDQAAAARRGGRDAKATYRGGRGSAAKKAKGGEAGEASTSSTRGSAGRGAGARGASAKRGGGPGSGGARRGSRSKRR